MKQPYHHGALRTALLNAAEAILDRDGINALTLRAAAREAGVSHGAPAHHFGDVTGLLTALAALGFERLHAYLVTETSNADPLRFVKLLGHAYVRFALAHRGIFLLMFRSERLDWAAPDLSEASAAAFSLLTSDQRVDEPHTAENLQALIVASTRWSLMHGLATLLIDGPLVGIASKFEGAELETLIDQVLERGLSERF
ncbi:TetR/AcrR family transcriptional regulator [Allorhizobium sp. BGMRC 0089]|uniref:TetR/AcrR family transcriptional regulator n=1 Tax=Allorhizobium sonneratiae TaxID=2934936 RepID=UPI002033AD0D|nr:TetR/AcrR family transcriptional regulator [Allorhizobium sonneratiae]MCM2292118.1 TetR/AcrR family transcriptional regulator [Allorhizobium sonneratiae]